MGIWSLRPNVDGMGCCSPNGSVGSVAMGKLWPFGLMPAQTFRNLENVKPLTFVKLCSLETNPEFWFQMWVLQCLNSGTDHWITDVKPLPQLWLNTQRMRTTNSLLLWLQFPRAKCHGFDLHKLLCSSFFQTVIYICSIATITVLVYIVTYTIIARINTSYFKCPRRF